MRFPGRRLTEPAALSRELEVLLGEAGSAGDGGSPDGAGARDALAPALLVGIEHEYRVVMRDDPLRRVDFRTMVHDLGLGRRHLDPDDPHAYRLRSGNVVTCDGPEAEIVLAPVEAIPGAATSIVRTADRERSALAARLPETLDLQGHSTHISVSVPTDLVEPVGRQFAAAFAVDVIRLVDSADRCGVWVRPRPDRLELCLDFVDADRLVGVVAFAIAATEACRLDVLGRPGSSSLPPAPLPNAVRLTPRRPRQRSGWNLPLRAVSGDPFDRDGSSPLQLAAGGRMPAAEHLSAAWRAIRELAATVASSDELEVVDRLVGVAGAEAARPTTTGPATPSAFGDALTPRDRRDYEVGVVALTWPFAVFLLLGRRRIGPRRRAFVCVPSRRLPRFLRLLDAGALDDLLRRYLDARPTGRRLAHRDQATVPGLFDELGLRRSLLPREPEVADISLDRVAVAQDRTAVA
ncbi:MAG TPA: hypothetical protein VEX41_09005 [Candidatus Eisenbacteria bacterium]|nr:hypothetical protein [Candidatus Eisenbacteria bacterium]